MTQADSQQASRLIHTGQVIVDLVMQIDTLPAPGGDVLAHNASFEVGGGFNVMAQRGAAACAWCIRAVMDTGVSAIWRAKR
jgi:hypothetical protein